MLEDLVVDSLNCKYWDISKLLECFLKDLIAKDMQVHVACRPLLQPYLLYLYLIVTHCTLLHLRNIINKSELEAIDIDQSVALMVAKATIDSFDTDGWKIRNENVY